MKINKNNYEAFLLDYLEGNLSAEITAALLLFLDNHPELDVDLTDFNIISSNENESITFNDKQNLKRKEFVINDDLIESLIISLVNGDLSKEETDKLLKVIKHDENYKKLYHQYLNTVLSAEATNFENKFLLKGHLPITSENIEYFLIAELENTLNENERKALVAFKTTFPGVKTLENNYAGTRLNRNELVIFTDKKSLKKKEAVVISFYSIARYVSVAAAACLILYFSFFSSSSNQTEVNFSFASDPLNENTAEEEKLIANQIDPIDNDEEKNKEEENLTHPNITNQNDMMVTHQSEKKINPTPIIIKEPVLDMANDFPIININEEEESPVLFAREEIKELINDDNNTIASPNTNLASLNEDDYISPGQYVRNWAKKTFFTEQANEKYSNETTELADNTLQLKGTDLKVKNAKSNDYKEYGFSIGKFSFSRKVKK